MQEKFRVDVQGVGETIWVSNALRFDTEAEAEAYARDLFARWMGMQAWRVVPESTPERQPVDPEPEDNQDEIDRSIAEHEQAIFDNPDPAYGP